MRAVGLTDHGTFAGAIQMLKLCRKANIENDGPPVKPIIGMESYLCKNRSCHKKECQPDGRKGNKHLNIIAKNLQGYHNLCNLSQKASLEGMYYDPRIDFDLLNEYKDGLIITSACLSNIVNWHLKHDRYEKAKKAATLFKDIFEDDYYLEIMFHGIPEEGKIIPDIQKLSKELNIKTIITNDSHYLEPEDADPQEVMMCMSGNRCIKDPNRMKFPYQEFYFKTKEQMYDMFKSLPVSLNNTIEIAEKCDYSDLLFVEEGGPMRLPKFELPEGYSNPYIYLKDLAKTGIRKLGWDKSPEHVARLKLELQDIELIYNTKRYDFSTYFLIVWDMMQFARKKGIATGIRGSGYGSVLIFCLGIGEGIDPLAYDLLWERFLGFDDRIFFSPDDFGIKQS